MTNPQQPAPTSPPNAPAPDSEARALLREFVATWAGPIDGGDSITAREAADFLVRFLAACRAVLDP